MKYFYSILILLFVYSCSKDVQEEVLVPPAGCDSTEMFYNKDIKPIISSNCSYFGCHSQGGEGSFDYTTYAGLANRIRAGRVLDRLALPVENPLHMPEHRIMDDCQLYKIRLWISQGYPNN
ncbi:MAG: hypothetical protein IPG90_00045 [Bacteroidetes bacterium]|nr:hypothetical protein [Bacteroidota bacterium]MBP6401210.1 hypothetical protein [Bacteroidia bacterium]MBK6836837.1 hypothetical protein [Bacteroidota bacterium]MBK9523749.1 hypothetical protein [Bacteroidota bacterium]MBK9541501.1 hypothetical protein [Bacteroidota bacterium]